jgi:hypothetical protein
MDIEKRIEDRRGKVIKTEILNPGSEHQLSPRGVGKIVKNYLFGETQETPPTTGQDASGVYRGSLMEKTIER